jgi:hypothetical protein
MYIYGFYYYYNMKLRLLLKNALFWVITQRVVVISDGRFGTTY